MFYASNDTFLTVIDECNETNNTFCTEMIGCLFLFSQVGPVAFVFYTFNCMMDRSSFFD